MNAAVQDSIPGEQEKKRIEMFNCNYYKEQDGNSRTYYLDNLNSCPLSMKVEYLGTLRSKMDKKQEFFVIPEKADRFKLYTIKDYTQEDKPNIRIYFRLGDFNDEEYDTEYAYTLPFEMNSEYEVTQSSNGGFSHQNKHSYDFKMPLGSAIHAARSGIVVQVKEDSNSGCGSWECSNQGNFILIYHDDGTFAAYYHLYQNGALVNLGDSVADGQLIGYSGNTGWSTGPHLHFEVYLPVFRKDQTIRPKFKLKLNSKPKYLMKNQVYKRVI